MNYTLLTASLVASTTVAPASSDASLYLAASVVIFGFIGLIEYLAAKRLAKAFTDMLYGILDVSDRVNEVLAKLGEKGAKAVNDVIDASYEVVGEQSEKKRSSRQKASWQVIGRNKDCDGSNDDVVVEVDEAEDEGVAAEKALVIMTTVYGFSTPMVIDVCKIDC